MEKNKNAEPALIWIRNDLRVADNPALTQAAASGRPVVAFYILDDNAPHPPGGASRWWLHHSLKSLAKDLSALGAQLVLRRGDSASVIKALISETGAKQIFWNRRYAPAQIEIDKRLKAEFAEDGVEVQTFGGNLLCEPWTLQTKTGGNFKVFTPFWRALRSAGPERSSPLPAPKKLTAPTTLPQSDDLDDWALLPTKPNWASAFDDLWTPGEAGAAARLKVFLDEPINHYADGRDRPDLEYTSRLSPHLAFGEISPLSIWTKTHECLARGAINDSAAEKFLSEIAWREFSYNLLYHFEDLPSAPLREQFKAFDWETDEEGLAAWQKGLTGYPIVDAGMRQLWQTGWMHNRVRMIVASFLIKDQLIPWQDGAAWFWDTLVDADIANNSASWQWVAGCGADAAPYFRIFNPVTQGEKFDPDGDYIRAFVPELGKMSAKYIHAPWKAPESELQRAGISLGKSYPQPILDHGAARNRALDRYNDIKTG